MRAPAPYFLRRFARSASDARYHTVLRESQRCPTGATRAQARRLATNMSTANPDDLVTLVRDTRIVATFRNGRAMRAAAIAQGVLPDVMPQQLEPGRTFH